MNLPIQLLLLFALILPSFAGKVVVPLGAKGYRYKVVPNPTAARPLPKGFQNRDFNDQSWKLGTAGFGTTTGCPLNKPKYVKTNWPANTDLLARKELSFGKQYSKMTIQVGIDNDVQVWVNGKDVSGGMKKSGSCKHSSGKNRFTFSVPDNVLSASESNIIAIRAHDYGGATYLDMQVTADVTEVQHDDLKPKVIVPFGSGDYIYKVVPNPNTARPLPKGFQNRYFDDESWDLGTAGFGTSKGGCSLNTPKFVKTNWPINTDLLARKVLPFMEYSKMKIQVDIDNDVQVWVNGKDVSGGMKKSGYCKHSTGKNRFTFSVPDSVLSASEPNVIAIRAHDYGGVAYFDMQVTAIAQETDYDD